MTETETPLDAIPAEKPDHNLGYLGEIKIHQDAEDVVVLRLVSRDGSETVDVQITDDSMMLLLEATEAVFTRIHGGMEQIRALFENE